MDEAFVRLVLSERKEMKGKATACRKKGDKQKSGSFYKMRRENERKKAKARAFYKMRHEKDEIGNQANKPEKKEEKMNDNKMCDVLPSEEARALRPWAGFKYAVMGIVAVGIACAIAEFVMRAAR